MSRVRTVVAWALVVLWVVVTVVGVRDATRETTYADLVAQVRGGAVTEVTVHGDVTRPRTVSTVELRWDGGLVDRSVRVTAARPLGMAQRGGGIKAGVSHRQLCHLPPLRGRGRVGVESPRMCP